MATSVKISENIFNEARTVSRALNRSIAGQIEYWAKLGKLSEENPEYNYEFIKDIDWRLDIVFNKTCNGCRRQKLRCIKSKNIKCMRCLTKNRECVYDEKKSKLVV